MKFMITTFREHFFVLRGQKIFSKPTAKNFVRLVLPEESR